MDLPWTQDPRMHQGIGMQTPRFVSLRVWCAARSVWIRRVILVIAGRAITPVRRVVFAVKEAA